MIEIKNQPPRSLDDVAFTREGITAIMGLAKTESPIRQALRLAGCGIALGHQIAQSDPEGVTAHEIIDNLTTQVEGQINPRSIVAFQQGLTEGVQTYEENRSLIV
jgi:hypothetical protein